MSNSDAVIAKAPVIVPISREPSIPKNAIKQITPTIIFAIEITFLLFKTMVNLSMIVKIRSSKDREKDCSFTCLHGLFLFDKLYFLEVLDSL